MEAQRVSIYGLLKNVQHKVNELIDDKAETRRGHELVCCSCGADWREGAQFCPKCGKKECEERSAYDRRVNGPSEAEVIEIQKRAKKAERLRAKQNKKKAKIDAEAIAAHKAAHKELISEALGMYKELKISTFCISCKIAHKRDESFCHKCGEELKPNLSKKERIAVIKKDYGEELSDEEIENITRFL